MHAQFKSKIKSIVPLEARYSELLGASQFNGAETNCGIAHNSFRYPADEQSLYMFCYLFSAVLIYLASLSFYVY